MAQVLDSLSYFFWVALALGILVFVHEMGHFLAARLFGMRVDAFSLGFAPNLIKKTVGQTEYRLGLIPLGGYVKIAGMVDESLDIPYELEPDVDEDGNPVLDEKGEPVLRQKLDGRGRPIPVSTEPKPDEYRAKPVWQRMIVISAGVVFNLILAFLIYSALALTYGRAYTPAENVRLDVVAGSVAEEMGLRTGDRVVAVNGEPVEQFEEVFTPTTLGADPLRLTVERGGERVELTGPDALMTRLSQAQRAATETGGPATFGTLFGADPQLPPVLAVITPGSAAERAGLRPGDRVVALNGEPIRSWTRLTEVVTGSEGRPLAVRWARADTVAAVDGSGAAVREVGRQGGATVYEAQIAATASGDRYVLGVGVDDTALGVRHERLGFGEGVAAGARQTWGITTTYFGFVGKLFTGRESLKENVGGPLMIAQQSKQAADRGGDVFWGFVAFLSVALAVFNILPIPALDGGHLVFLAYEAIARREPSLKVRIAVQQVGLFLILALMAFVIFNDVARWVG